MASLMVAGTPSLPNLLFLLSTLLLLGSAVVCVRDHSGRTPLVVQSAAAGALLSLFWVGGRPAQGGPSITIGHSTYELTLTLAALLFVALALARLLRPKPEQACNCG